MGEQGMIIHFSAAAFLILSLISISRNIPVWAPAIAMLFIIIKFIMIYYHTEPNRRITGFLISGFFTFILAVHGTQDRLQFSSLFLCLLTGLKYIDISAHQRDRQYFALSATLLTGTVLLNSRDSVNIMLSILSIPVYWSLSTSGPIPVKRFLKIGLLSFIPAFILMGLSIRVSSRLSLMSTGKARTGLGETVMPGNISELAMNRDPVLKLEADGRWNDVYLRSAVFDRTDGFNWFGSVQEARTAVFPMQKDFSGPTAKIYLRPVTDGWVPTMENIYNVSKNAAFSGNADTGYRYNENKMIYYIFHYDRKSSVPAERSADLKEYMTVPKYDRDIQDWLERNGIAGSLNAENKLKLLVRTFKQKRFRYSLKPGKLKSKNRLKEFLFESRVGFCEHYASSFAILLRYLSVPTRLITGYQGAEYNRLGKYWSVTQASAHAWLEYWEDGHWHRFDPTAEIEPDRVNSDPTLFLDFLIKGDRSVLDNSDIFREIKSALSSVSEALDWQLISGIQLNLSFLEFTLISEVFPESEILLYSLFITVFSLSIYILYIKHNYRSEEAAEAEMEKFIQELKKRNLFADPLISPSEKLKRTEELLKTEMHLHQEYERLKFAEETSADSKSFQRKLKKLIRILKKQRRRNEDPS
ncbi:MAG TPA: transglutaminaseTgpA domain-containing protein [Leptospiraceae bacterium]|nr:transglutaminaseTgpA domain-containing protein [Leptospiraceae bacterium]